MHNPERVELLFFLSSAGETCGYSNPSPAGFLPKRKTEAVFC
jgi:hypothetical protein